MDSANQVDQRPEPRWSIFTVAKQAVDDGPPLDVHRVDADLVGEMGDGSNPLDTVVERVTLGHEGRLEQEIGLDSQTIFP